MIGMRFASFQGEFFNTHKVVGAVDRATRGVLSRFGAYVRTRARTSIRKRKKASQPGQPPSSHRGLLRSGIFFGYEMGPRSVVIGPARLSGMSAEIPPALEYGGTTKRRGKSRGKGRKRARIAARPFMTPAFQAEQPQLPALWRNSVKRN